jgi:hypothetical protein
MGRIWGLTVATTVVAVASLTACGKPKNVDLTGTWKYVSDMKGGATIVLRRDGTYKFCTPGNPCEIGQYSVVTASSSDDDNGDRINFSGDALAGFEGSYAQTEDVHGHPMKVVSWHITYGLFGKPWIKTGGPDSPDHYEKASDQTS